MVVLGWIHCAMPLSFPLFQILRQDLMKFLSSSGWAWICDPPSSASQSARIRGTCQSAQVKLLFFFFNLRKTRRFEINPQKFYLFFIRKKWSLSGPQKFLMMAGAHEDKSTWRPINVIICPWGHTKKVTGKTAIKWNNNDSWTEKND